MPRFLERGSPWDATAAPQRHHHIHIHPGTAISVSCDIPSPEGTPTTLGKERTALPKLGAAGLGMELLVVLVDLGSNAAVLAEGRGCSQDVFHACRPSCCKKTNVIRLGKHWMGRWCGGKSSPDLPQRHSQG